jgi:hypothetical protein
MKNGNHLNAEFGDQIAGAGQLHPQVIAFCIHHFELIQ